MSAAARKSPARILVVEDERDIAALVAYHLTKDGYRVRTAEGGQEALAAAAAGRSCQVTQPGPEMTLRDLLQAAKTNDRDLVFQLLTPATRARLVRNW